MAVNPSCSQVLSDDDNELSPWMIEHIINNPTIEFAASPEVVHVAGNNGASQNAENFPAKNNGDSPATGIRELGARKEVAGSGKVVKRRKEAAAQQESGEFSDHQSAGKKPRLIWTQELHELFVAAVKELSASEKVVPKKILEYMKKMGFSHLTRENVASHLQKYRMHLKKQSDEKDPRSSNLPQESVSLNGSKTSNFKRTPIDQNIYNTQHTNSCINPISHLPPQTLIIHDGYGFTNQPINIDQTHFIDQNTILPPSITQPADEFSCYVHREALTYHQEVVNSLQGPSSNMPTLSEWTSEADPMWPVQSSVGFAIEQQQMVQPFNEDAMAWEGFNQSPVAYDGFCNVEENVSLPTENSCKEIFQGHNTEFLYGSSSSVNFSQDYGFQYDASLENQIINPHSNMHVSYTNSNAFISGQMQPQNPRIEQRDVGSNNGVTNANPPGNVPYNGPVMQQNLYGNQFQTIK